MNLTVAASLFQLHNRKCLAGTRDNVILNERAKLFASL
jgi:hypothetical protein